MSAGKALVEIIRGPLVESRHSGSIAVMDDQGRMVFSWGDPERAVYPRSAVKAIQALPLVESGAADRFAFSDTELALACASHSGEAMHIETAAGVLRRLDLDEGALECGAHWPLGELAARELAWAHGKPTNLHNNCSGKHCGFLALAKQRGYAFTGYVRANHPVQNEVRKALEEMTGAALSPTSCGTDGCSIPTYAVPLSGLARGFAQFGSGRGLAPERAKAAARLRAACAIAPQMVAGTGRFCTDVMRLFGERVFVKTGAEGVFCGALPQAGLGFALKIDDGATRASEITAASIIARFAALSDEERASFVRWTHPVLRNWRGSETGAIRLASDAAQALEAA